MLDEIEEIPKVASVCYTRNNTLKLPSGIPYLGMGSSYFATLALKYLGINIYPEIASEYYRYNHLNKSYPTAVLVSQSGYSSETIWASERFPSYHAITNDPDSPLATSDKRNQLILLHTGKEEFSATKSYLNTLITLYLGFSLDCEPAIRQIRKNMKQYQEWGIKQAGSIAEIIGKHEVNGIYILGSGPNLATAYQAGLILTECTKIPIISMALAQYDHGPKEAANHSLVLPIITEGPNRKRAYDLVGTIQTSGAKTILCEESNLPESLTPLTSILYFNFLAYYLAKELGIEQTFEVGNKVTTVKK